MEYILLNTTDIGQLTRIISSEMRGEMKSAILYGQTRAYKGFRVGNVFIEVDVPVWENMEEYSVTVVHPNYEHYSPRIEEAIRKGLPEWADVERDAQESKREWEAQERCQWLNRYN